MVEEGDIGGIDIGLGGDAEDHDLDKNENEEQHLARTGGSDTLLAGMRDFLELSYERLRNSEKLRRDVKVASEKSPMKSGGDLQLVEEESAINIHNVIIGLEMLRLMCEGHNEVMQNYLREQTENGFVRVNSVNMLIVVTNMLIKYKEIIDDFNISLGNAIFEYFIELLQGPCYPNQIEICKTKLLETVEDMLIELVLGAEDVGLM